MQLLDHPDTLQSTKLLDGRTLSYSVCGSSTGHPLLFFHPIQGNRLQPLILHKAAEALHLKVIALDRPGYCQSSPLPCRTVKQYPQDVVELCAQLRISKFSIMASSAGTLYALACTLAPETKDMVVGKVTIIAPWIPHSSRAPGFSGWLSVLGRWTPVPLLYGAIGLSNIWVAHQAYHKPVVELMQRSSNAERAAFASDPDNDVIYKAMIHQWGLSLGGIIQEMQLCMERTPLQQLHYNYCQDVTHPVRVYMGTADTMLLHSHAQYWADNSIVKNVELITVEGGMHDGLIHTQKVAALKALFQDLQDGLITNQA